MSEDIKKARELSVELSPVSKPNPEVEKFVMNLACALQNPVIKTLFGNILHDEIETVTQEFENRLRLLEANNMELVVENKNLKRIISHMEDKQISLAEELDELAQYSRRNTLRITNPWEEMASESTDDLVKTMAKDLMGVELSDQDIGRSHRIGKKNGKPRTIVVGFMMGR